MSKAIGILGRMALVVGAFWGSCVVGAEALPETLPPLDGKAAPQSLPELWSGFDPQAEPLDVEILKEWEEDGVVVKVLRYRIGVFKGKKAMMAAVYGYPKGAAGLPGLVQIHGGGQYADYKAVLTNAKRGYATISISWAGRISSPKHRVSPREVKLFWEDKTDDPAYRVTTDWGALDGYHAPSRDPKTNFKAITTGPRALDPVRSPRNNPWFLCALGARRALTFLEQSPAVDPNRLGVYGHSMGGKLTVLTTGADKRVKAAAPSCGGISDRYNEDPIFQRSIADHAYLKQISCPIVFLSPANDFHGRIQDLKSAVTEVNGDWRVTCAPHHNHQDTPRYEVATQLWFDQHLKKTFRWPSTPMSKLVFPGAGAMPRFAVKPDTSKSIVSVDVFYSQQGAPAGEKDVHSHSIARYWSHAKPTKQGDSWVADLPVTQTNKPLWVYANVTYAMDQKVSGAGYYYGSYITNQFVVSSLMATASAKALRAAGIENVNTAVSLIEDFAPHWEKEWFTYKPENWAISTRKVYDAQYAAPAGATLSLEVRSAAPNVFVVKIDAYAAEVDLKGGGHWQQLQFHAKDFLDANGASLGSWSGIKELRLSAQETLRGNKTKASLTKGAAWNGDAPSFRNLKWAPKQ